MYKSKLTSQNITLPHQLVGSAFEFRFELRLTFDSIRICSLPIFCFVIACLYIRSQVLRCQAKFGLKVLYFFFILQNVHLKSFKLFLISTTIIFVSANASPTLVLIKTRFQF